MPGEDFFTWAHDENQNQWGQHVSDCFATFHIPRDNSQRFRNISGINDTVEKFLADNR